jgi:hypothetical protein
MQSPAELWAWSACSPAIARNKCCLAASGFSAAGGGWAGEAGEMGSAGNGCRRVARFEVTHSEVALLF